MPTNVGRLQEGIYIVNKRPGRAYRLLLLDIRPGAGAEDVHKALTEVWALLTELRRGEVRELRSTRADDPKAPITVPRSELTCLLGFGASLFKHAPAVVEHGDPPDELLALHPDRDANQPFPSLGWTSHARSRGDADIAIQLIAETELAVTRAVVDVCSLIADPACPLQLVTFHGGFNREDSRSWLNFHDGLSNLASGERQAAVEVVRKDPQWMHQGTYMAFLRLAVDLAAWRALDRAQQEGIIGRHKLTGCPLESVPADGLPRMLKGCPFTGNPPGSSGHREPGLTSDPVLDVSHIHRVNPTREGPKVPGSNRIYRQGYEFLEMVGEGQWRAGINFVSFQRSLTHINTILTERGWMRTANFGGRAQHRGPGLIQLASIIGAGYYAVPPNGDGGPFPGADIFRKR